MGITDLDNLWNKPKAEEWESALRRYWLFVKPSNFNLEKEMERLKTETISAMDETEWFIFLHKKYFKWKYTAPNRYASTTRLLIRSVNERGLTYLFEIRNKLLNFDLTDIELGLQIAAQISGLGPPGASGLLAILYPSHFGTIDQFAVKALLQVPDLKEGKLIAKMKPGALKIQDGVILISIMRTKARELNTLFATDKWSPRNIDMVLWTCGR